MPFRDDGQSLLEDLLECDLYFAKERHLDVATSDISICVFWRQQRQRAQVTEPHGWQGSKVTGAALAVSRY
jgi:hypothetical protein